MLDPKAEKMAEKVGATTVVQSELVSVDPKVVPASQPAQQADTPPDATKNAGHEQEPEPQPDDKEAVENNKVRFLIAAAIGVFLLGVMLIIAGFLLLGVFVALIAAIIVAFAVFATIR